MVVTDYNEQFLDKRGTAHIIEELKAYIDSIASGDIDLSNYVTKSELQAKLDALDINIDLSSYATKEELTNAINSIDLSAYALKTEIPSLDGYATTEYVDNAIANVPSGGGTTDLSNYYTKEEVYNKEEVDAMITSDSSTTATVLSYEDWLTLNTTYDMNIDLSGKTIYIDTSKRFSDMLEDTFHELWFYNNSVDGKVSCGRRITYENGKLIISHGKRTDKGSTIESITLFDKTKEEGDTFTYAGSTVSGTYHNGWRIADAKELAGSCLVNKCFTLGDDIYNPCYDYYREGVSADDDTVVTIDQTIKGEELLDAFLRCVTMIIDADGNEVAFKTVPSASEYLAYIDSCDSNDNSTGESVDLSNYYTKEETDALIPTVTDGKDGVSPTITENADNSDTVYKLDITDANGTFTTPNLKGADGASGSGDSGTSSTGSNDFPLNTEVVVGTYMNKPLYRKMIELGEITVGTHTIARSTFTSENIGIVKIGGQLINVYSEKMNLPFFESTSSYASAYLTDYDANIKIISKVSSAHGSAWAYGYLYIEYTKISDK